MADPPYGLRKKRTTATGEVDAVLSATAYQAQLLHSVLCRKGVVECQDWSESVNLGVGFELMWSLVTVSGVTRVSWSTPDVLTSNPQCQIDTLVTAKLKRPITSPDRCGGYSSHCCQQLYKFFDQGGASCFCTQDLCVHLIKIQMQQSQNRKQKQTPVIISRKKVPLVSK